MNAALGWSLSSLLLIWLSASLAEPQPAFLGVAAPAVGAPHSHPVARPIEKILYSEFNHRTSGLAVAILGLLALSAEVGLARRPHLRVLWWLWPAGWILFGIFLFVRSDPNNWPWGAIGFWETLRDAETRQHKVAACVVIAIGVIEGLRAGQRLQSQAWASVFPLLGIGAAILLGLHSQVHVLTPRVYLHHMAGAVLGVAMGASKLLCDQGFLRGRFGRFLWPSLLLLFGVQFMFYTER